MKKKILIYPLIVMGFVVMLTSSCKKSDSTDDTTPTPTPTPTATTVTDISGNVYHTVTIGTQVWMVENLKTTKLNDGTSIPEITNNADWSNLTTPGYCWYNNNSATSYGALYNWYTVNTGKLCPTGWHVASDTDWKTLEKQLGMSDLELDFYGDWRGGDAAVGGQLKETGTAHWAASNAFCTNQSGFTALPCGLRAYEDGTFSFYSTEAYFWTSTAYDATEAWMRVLSSSDIRIWRSTNNYKEGHCVRCVKN